MAVIASAACQSGAAPDAGPWSADVGPLPSVDIVHDDIRALDYARQLDFVVPYLLEERSTADLGRNLSTYEVQGEQEEWAQATLNDISRDLATAITAGKQSTVLGRNLLAGVYMPSADRSKRDIENGIMLRQERFAPRYIVVSVSRSFDSGFIDLGTSDLEIASETHLVNAVSMDTASELNIYLAEQTSADRQHTVHAIAAIVGPESRLFLSGEYVPGWRPRPA